MDKSSRDHAEYFRARAAEARAKAETIDDLDARRVIRDVAAMWERLAKRLEKKNSGQSN